MFRTNIAPHTPRVQPAPLVWKFLFVIAVKKHTKATKQTRTSKKKKKKKKKQKKKKKKKKGNKKGENATRTPLQVELTGVPKPLAMTLVVGKG